MFHSTPFATTSNVPRQAFHPLSPPETDLESTLASEYHPSDAGSSRLRRAPSIFYKQGEARETWDTRTAKPHRWLLVVNPPAILNVDSHGDEDNQQTSSIRPPSSGVLMPLFPTVSNCVTARVKNCSIGSTIDVRSASRDCARIHLT